MVYRPLRYEQMMQAAEAHDVRARRMFGGMGIYTGDKMFALLVGEDVGFKLAPDDLEEALRIPGTCVMKQGDTDLPMNGYVRMPKTVLDNREAFHHWLERSCNFVRRKSGTLH